MADEPRKRSRFDQAEPVADPRRSRFDRRSRSPSNRDSEVKRDRSPVARSVESPAGNEKKESAAAAAAAAAARINASIQAKKAAQPVDVPPIRSTQSPSLAVGSAKSPSAGAGAVAHEIYQQDGDYIKDIEVNDLRNRYTLTKGSTQKMIKEKTGADVTTRGAYYPDKSMATAANPPLYLHITSTTKEGLEKAVAEIDQMMSQELPNLIDERRFRRREPEPTFERDERGRRKWPEEKIPVDLEPIPGFNLRAQVVGQGGSYVKHIQQETRCRVQIKGRGSGFMEHDTGHESDEQMYLHVAGPDPNEVQRAKELCLDLLGNVRTQYEAFKERGPRGGDRGDFGDRGGQRGGYGDRDRNSSYNGYGGYGGHGSPAAPQSASAMSPGAGAPQAAAGFTAEQYAQYYGQDPYAAYGGYEGYMKYYYEWVASGGAQQMAAQQTGAQQSPLGAQAAGYNTNAPPPPPSDEQAPPPPPPGAGAGGYNAVPPPPGM